MSAASLIYILKNIHNIRRFANRHSNLIPYDISDKFTNDIIDKYNIDKRSGGYY